ncbi:hypothetical protein Dimus_035220 [Dionaea muscipula]
MNDHQWHPRTQRHTEPNCDYSHKHPCRSQTKKRHPPLTPLHPKETQALKNPYPSPMLNKEGRSKNQHHTTEEMSTQAPQDTSHQMQQGNAIHQYLQPKPTTKKHLKRIDQSQRKPHTNPLISTSPHPLTPSMNKKNPSCIRNPPDPMKNQINPISFFPLKPPRLNAPHQNPSNHLSFFPLKTTTPSKPHTITPPNHHTYIPLKPPLLFSPRNLLSFFPRNSSPYYYFYLRL